MSLSALNKKERRRGRGKREGKVGGREGEMDLCLLPNINNVLGNEGWKEGKKEIEIPW